VITEMPRNEVTPNEGQTKSRDILYHATHPFQQQKQWTGNDMHYAIDAVKGGEKILRVEKLYSVPHT